MSDIWQNREHYQCIYHTYKTGIPFSEEYLYYSPPFDELIILFLNFFNAVKSILLTFVLVCLSIARALYHNFCLSRYGLIGSRFKLDLDPIHVAREKPVMILSWFEFRHRLQS